MGAKCGASKRQGGACGRPAGWGTDHVGEGRCKLHGGATPIKHGRYSKVGRPRLQQLIEQFTADPDPMNLLPEVAMLRALVTDYVERYDAFTAALLAWHESYLSDKVENPKPRQMVDIVSASRFVADIGNLVDKIHRQRQEGSVSLETFQRVMEQLGVEVVHAAAEVIPDADQRAALVRVIERRWGTIKLESSSRRGQRPT